MNKISGVVIRGEGFRYSLSFPKCFLLGAKATATLDENSLLAKHHMLHSNEIDLENVEILDRSRTRRQRIILQAWHSVRDTNSINKHIALLSVYKTGADPGEGRRVTIPPPLSLCLLAVICSSFLLLNLFFPFAFFFLRMSKLALGKAPVLLVFNIFEP